MTLADTFSAHIFHLLAQKLEKEKNTLLSHLWYCIIYKIGTYRLGPNYKKKLKMLLVRQYMQIIFIELAALQVNFIAI